MNLKSKCERTEHKNEFIELDICEILFGLLLVIVWLNGLW